MKNWNKEVFDNMSYHNEMALNNVRIHDITEREGPLSKEDKES